MPNTCHIGSPIPLNRDFFPIPREQSLGMISRIAEKFYKSLDSAVSLKCFLLLRHEEWDQLVTASVSPFDYIDGEAFADDYAAVSLLKKCNGLPTTFNCRLEALRATANAEARNSVTFRRLLSVSPSSDISEVVDFASSFLLKLLGPAPDEQEIFSNISFGPGASSSCRGLDTSVYYKLDSQLDVTPDALAMARNLVRTIPNLRPDHQDVLGDSCALGEAQFNIVQGNVFTSVPKTASTDRGICIEPHVNILLQKSLGVILRQRLSRDYDLSNQAEVNRDYAKLGSIYGSFATIDLSSASDTITTLFVKTLLPSDWFELLDSLRSKYTVYPDTVFKNFKFSSMGNGFTFELESILFYSLCVACCRVTGHKAEAFAFGDDLIVPTGAVDLLLRALSYLGFTPNEQKSYSSGPFRESCGADFWNGQNIRPFFIRNLPDGKDELLKLANGLRLYARRRGSDFHCDLRFRAPWYCITDLLPKGIFSIGPESAGDTVLWADRSEFREGTFFAPYIRYGITYIRSKRRKPRKSSFASRRKMIHGALMSYPLSPIPVLGNFGLSLPMAAPRTERGSQKSLKTSAVAVPVASDSPQWL